MDWLERTTLLLGEEKVNLLKEKHVLIVGLGGVGAYAAEMIARAGIGKLTIIDADVINHSNINRQLLALSTTVNISKAKLMKERLLKINPDIIVNKYHDFFNGEKFRSLFQQNNFDYVVDAIDSLSPKVELIKTAIYSNVKIVSSMGAGAKLDPTKITISDISKSKYCTLARAVRKRLHKFNIHKGFDVVYSTEQHKKEHIIEVKDERNKKTTTGTISYMPAIFGCWTAFAVINNIV